MKHPLLAAAALLICVSGAAAQDRPEVLATYADIAAASYDDSPIAALRLQASVAALTEAPSAEALQAAKDDWIVARAPYQQTEAFRFGNPVVDDWEGRVNAWPLDEGLIDHVDASYGGGDADRHGQPVLWRTGGPAHAPRPGAEQPGGGA